MGGRKTRAGGRGVDEAQWLTSTDGAALLGYACERERLLWRAAVVLVSGLLRLRQRPPTPRRWATPRKRRLLACACCRAVAHLFPDDRFEQAVAVVERFADGLVGPADPEAMRRPLAESLNRLDICVSYPLPADSPPECAAAAVWHLVAWQPATFSPGLGQFAPAAGPDVAVALLAREADAAHERGQAGLVRDVFGNPFRPARFSPAWRTAEVLRLAE